ncbi:hypothetical protein [Paradesulfitobacterium ferrireducens]|uniref:hypothetical protein n=1 Tax=Paradesulfitobacterium ferrireducens TaxID=2816476 RepID=UPI001F24A206|nr:hypothetical protein [Paradesulfitobacterium ferrireducens]
MPVSAVLFLSIPEELLITTLGLFLFGISVRKYWYRLFLIAVIQALVSFFIRLLPLPFGIHTFLMIPLFALAVSLVLNLPYIGAFVSILVSSTIYTVLDTTFIPLLIKITGIPVSEVLQSTPLRVMFFLPQGLTMLVLILIVATTGFRLFTLSDYRSAGSRKQDGYH